MDLGFWNDRWRDGRIGFHLDRTNPMLIKHARALGPPPSRVFVPLCGKTHDLTWLMERGHTVVGIEFVGKAIDEYFSGRQPEPVHRFAAGPMPGRRAGRVSILEGDFFDLTREILAQAAGGPIDAVYDRAALVAVIPARRADYLAKLAAVSPPGTRLLLINFVHDSGTGPPFSVPDDELAGLARGRFELHKADERDILDTEGRFRERGATFMREQVWSGSRS